ncbi:MAG TPA: hypothetical protein VJJ23_05190 [Candidatus Nanoarchaeia archaeon]|nr:hypothetical protein [Candidatus Nanoarchaeia archaeon]
MIRYRVENYIYEENVEDNIGELKYLNDLLPNTSREIVDIVRTDGEVDTEIIPGSLISLCLRRKETVEDYVIAERESYPIFERGAGKVSERPGTRLRLVMLREKGETLQ